MSHGERTICTTDRRVLRAWIPDGYSPAKHLLAIFGGGTLAAALLLLLNRHDIRLADALAIPLVALVGSFLEYVAHRWVMHVKLPIGKLAWEAHVGRHHHYYRADEPTWDAPGDICLILFSISDVAVLALALAAPVAALAAILPRGAWAVSVASAMVYFLIYEAVHLACHLPEGHRLLRYSVLARLRRRHLRHHLLDDMHANYGVTGRIWDSVFGTEA